MLARRNRLTHPRNGCFDLPLLVPAFSSKGFGFEYIGRGKKKREFSEVANFLPPFAYFHGTSALVSAYDLHFGHLVTGKSDPPPTLSALQSTPLVFIDSGGYELNLGFDSTEPKVFNTKPRSGYAADEYERVLRHRIHGIRKLQCVTIANFDYRKKNIPLKTQIAEARRLFKKFPQFLSDFIVKPWEGEKTQVDFSTLSPAEYADLKGFNIIGVPEKNLGNKLIDRLRNLATLRRGLDLQGILVPIHVWGGLDPVLTPLMFFAGAEIFDGVSWLRYAFRGGIAIALDSNTVLKEDMGLDMSFGEMRAHTRIENIRYLEQLSVLLQQWVDYEGKSFAMFEPNVGNMLEKAYKWMITKKIF